MHSAYREICLWRSAMYDVLLAGLCQAVWPCGAVGEEVEEGLAPHTPARLLRALYSIQSSALVALRWFESGALCFYFALGHVDLCILSWQGTLLLTKPTCPPLYRTQEHTNSA